MAGGLMGRVPKIMQTAEECRQTCFDLEGCVGFTFVKSQMDRHNCAVKSAWVPGRKSTNNGCCDSGRVTDYCRNTFKGINYGIVGYNCLWTKLNKNRKFKGYKNEFQTTFFFTGSANQTSKDHHFYKRPKRPGFEKFEIIIGVLIITVLVALVVLISLCCCHLGDKNKKPIKSNKPPKCKEPNIRRIFQRTSTLPHQQSSICLPNESTTNTYSKYDAYQFSNPLVVLNEEDELTPPPAIYIIPPT